MTLIRYIAAGLLALAFTLAPFNAGARTAMERSMAMPPTLADSSVATMPDNCDHAMLAGQKGKVPCAPSTACICAVNCAALSLPLVASVAFAPAPRLSERIRIIIADRVPPPHVGSPPFKPPRV